MRGQSSANNLFIIILKWRYFKSIKILHLVMCLHNEQLISDETTETNLSLSVKIISDGDKHGLFSPDLVHDATRGSKWSGHLQVTLVVMNEICPSTGEKWVMGIIWDGLFFGSWPCIGSSLFNIKFFLFVKHSVGEGHRNTQHVSIEK